MAGARKLGRLLEATYGTGTIGIDRNCSTGTSEHKEGRAVDWMVNVNNTAQREAAADFLSWLTADGGAEARRLGVMYVIYNSRIWSIYRLSEGWRSYTGYSPHTDHVHISLSWAGARASTSFWSGKVSAPDYGRCSVFTGQLATLRQKPLLSPCGSTVSPVKQSSHGTLTYGAVSSSMPLARRQLGLAESSTFDGAAWAAVKHYQRSHDLPLTGALDGPTWSSLVARSVTYDAIAGFTVGKAARYGLKHYADVVLTKHRAGRSVEVLQRALDLPRAVQNGYYGAATITAVQRLRADNGLAPGGADRAVWRILRG